MTSTETKKSYESLEMQLLKKWWLTSNDRNVSNKKKLLTILSCLMGVNCHIAVQSPKNRR